MAEHAVSRNEMICSGWELARAGQSWPASAKKLYNHDQNSIRPAGAIHWRMFGRGGIGLGVKEISPGRCLCMHVGCVCVCVCVLTVCFSFEKVSQSYYTEGWTNLNSRLWDYKVAISNGNIYCRLFLLSDMLRSFNCLYSFYSFWHCVCA